MLDIKELVFALIGCLSMSVTQVVIKKLSLLKWEVHSNLFFSSLIGIILSILLLYNDYQINHHNTNRNNTNDTNYIS